MEGPKMHTAHREKNSLPRITLGRTEIEVSQLGLGGFHQVEISSEIVEQVISTYLELGGNYVETARSYGNGASEEKIGRALDGRRDQVILESKSEIRDGDGIRKDLEISLKNLRTDRIEFYFLHLVNTEEEIHRIAGPGGALSALLQAKEEGLISGIGFSSHRPPDIYRIAIERLPISVILIWDNYLEELYLPEIQRKIYPLAREKGIGILSMKPLADGFLYRSVEKATRYALGSGSELIVCGMNSPQFVDEVSSAVCKGPLNEEERQTVLRQAPELGNYVCRQCGDCPDELMKLFRLEGIYDRQMIDYLEHDPADYALRLRLSGWFHYEDIARQRFSAEAWDAEHLLADAKGVNCPYQIDVPRKTRLAVAKLRDEEIRTI